METKKITNILLSFSAVTNTNSWRVKSALSNVVSLGLPTYDDPLIIISSPQPDQHYIIFEAWKWFFEVLKRRSTHFDASKFLNDRSGRAASSVLDEKKTLSCFKEISSSLFRKKTRLANGRKIEMSPINPTKFFERKKRFKLISSLRYIFDGLTWKKYCRDVRETN